MRGLIILLAFIFASVIVVGQESNFREGDFSKKEVQVKTLKLGNIWTFGKNATTGALEWKYGATTVYSISPTGAPTLSGAISGTTGTFSGALAAATLNTGQGANELYDMDQNVLTTSSPSFVSVNTDAAGYFLNGSKTLIDSAYYYPSRTSGSSTWLVWATRDPGTPKNRWKLQNLSTVSLQDKAGTGQIAIITRDTSGSVATAAIGNVSTITTQTISVTAGTITGTAAMRGHANFTNTEKVVKVYVPGAVANDYFFIQANQADSTTAVLDTDNLTAFVKTDTLVVVRPASGTSGLQFDWFRIK